MKKASIAVALALVFGLFAAAFSLAPAIAQIYGPSNPSSTDTSGNATSTTGTSNSTGTDNQTSTEADGSTFSASGRIAALIYDIEDSNDTETTEATSDTSSSNATSFDGAMSSNTTLPQTTIGSDDTTLGNTTGTSNTTSGMSDTGAEEKAHLPYIVSGDWSLDVQDGNVTDFAANFTMVHTDGTGRHTHDVSNFQASNSSALLLEQDGITFVFGTTDVMLNGSSGWTGVDTLIVLENSNAASLTFRTDDDHFKGQALYGIVDSLTDENGNELVLTTETAQQGNATEIGRAIDDAANQTGSFFGNISEGFQDIT